MSWKVLAPVQAPEGVTALHGGCLVCPPAQLIAPMNMLIAVGFGDAHISRDGKTVFDENSSDDFHFLEEFEAQARADPDHDWRCVLDAPLHSREYQRQGEGRWVLIRQGDGFA